MRSNKMTRVVATLLASVAMNVQIAAADSPQAAVPPWSIDAAFAQTTLPDGRTLIVGHASLDAHGSPFFSLDENRTGATATVLPNGKVLIWGGLDVERGVIAGGEWFDPESNGVSDAASVALLPRAGHTATVLTDGRLLMTGGWNTALGPLTEAELWDYRTNRSELLSADLVPPRTGHSATLLADGRVLIVGGYDSEKHRFVDSALFDPTKVSFVDVSTQSALNLQADDGSPPAVAASIPIDHASDFPYDGLIALRFSKLLDVISLSDKTITLIGPSGPTDIRVVPAEAGRLVFVQPVIDLVPAARYSLFISGAHRSDNSELPFTTLSFTTVAVVGTGNVVHGIVAPPASPTNGASQPPSDSGSLDNPQGRETTTTPSISPKNATTIRTGSAEAVTEFEGTCTNQQMIHGYQFCRETSTVQDGIFIPGHSNTNGRWLVSTPTPKLLAPSDVSAEMTPATTSVFGTVRRIDDAPLAGATVALGDITATTDSTGRFILNGVPSGKQALLVDGSTANRTGEEYGEFYAAVTLKDKQANAVPFNLYVPRITARDKVSITAPSDSETIITHPAIPGLEIHIPAGTVVRDRHGKVLTQLALVPLPSDRSPVPLPANFPVYFSLQPGTAVVQGLTPDAAKGMRVVYPNYLESARGLQQLFWFYDAGRDGWKVYTTGHLSDDEMKAMPDGELGLNTAMPGGNSVGGPTPPLPQDQPPPDGCQGGGDGGGGYTGPDPPPVDFGGGSPDGGPATAAAPVDCYTGMFSYTATDFHINDILPISLTRHYGIAWNSAWNANFIFGRGMMNNYAIYLFNPSGNNAPPVVDLVLPNGSVIPFNMIAGNLDPGGPGLWISQATGVFFGARLTNNEYVPSPACQICVTLRDGTVLGFPPAGTATDPSWVTYIQDRFGNKVTLGYNLANIGGVYYNELTSISSPNTTRTLTLHYTNGLVSSVTDNGPTPRTVSYTYGQKDQLNGNVYDLLTTVKYPDGTTENYSYDPSTDRLQTVTDRRGNVVITNNMFDTSNRLTQQTLGDNAVYKFAYNGGSTDVTDPNLNVRHTTFDAQGYPVSVTRGYGTSSAQTTTFTRGAGEFITLKTDPLGQQTRFAYDPSGNVTSVTLLAYTPNAVTYTYTYTTDGLNLLQSETDPLGHTINYSYTNGCLTGITDALGNTTTLTCNNTGQRSSVTDPNGNTTLYTYYRGNDLHTVTNALGYTTTYTTDTLGRITSIQDAQGDLSQIQYDVPGTTRYGVNDPPLSTTDPLSHTTHYGYDNNVNLTSVIDPNNNPTQYGYDKRNRRNLRTDGLLISESWLYDGVGHVKTYTDRKNQATTTLYDPLNRPSLITFADSSTITPTFDAGNRLTKVVDTVSGTITRAYDGLDRLTQEQTPQGTINYTYDNASRRQTMIPASQAVVNYTFDAASRLTNLAQASDQVQFFYDNANRRVSTALPNGVIEAYGYDGANELLSIAATSKTNVLANLVYTYDGVGRRSSQSGEQTTVLPTPTTATSTFNANNEQTSFDSSTLSYDANGNSMVSAAKGSNTYTWDARNRLTQISGGATASFTYDSFGRRTSKTISGVTTSFLYDRWNIVQETQGSTVTKVLSGLAIDERFARDDAALGRTYFLTDALGSTVALTDTTGTIQQAYSYEAYGEFSVDRPSTNPYQYTGRENDGTGLYYYRARYYSPSLKRFISEDPMGLAAGLNGYAYVLGNPVSFNDPDGYGVKEWICALSIFLCSIPPNQPEMPGPFDPPTDTLPTQPEPKVPGWPKELNPDLAPPKCPVEQAPPKPQVPRVSPPPPWWIKLLNLKPPLIICVLPNCGMPSPYYYQTGGTDA